MLVILLTCVLLYECRLVPHLLYYCIKRLEVCGMKIGLTPTYIISLCEYITETEVTLDFYSG